MNPIRADLHLHSRYSDGKYWCEEVIERVAKAGIGAVALTDHDTVEGLPDAAAACAKHGISFIAGSEISVEVLGEEIHLLAYDFDPNSRGLGELFKAQQSLRIGRARAFIEALRAAGLPIPPLDEVEDDFDGSVGRPHIAQILMDAGVVETIGEAFGRFLTPGTPTFIPKSFPAARDVMRVVHEAGGAAVLAHPGHHTSHRIVRSMIDDGLDGIEVNHPSHDDNLVAYYTNEAQRNSLIATGGSDYHGWREGEDENLGVYYVPWDPSGNLFRRRTL